MGKFRLLAGKHFEPTKSNSDKRATKRTSREHVAGTDTAIVESDEDLVGKFPNKFARVTEDELIVTAQRRVQVGEMLHGGTWKEEDRKVLESMPEGAFQKIKTMSGISAPNAISQERTEGPGLTKSVVVSSLGQDVTEEFERAEDGKLKVWVNPQKKHNVTTEAEPNKPLNDAPLVKNAVDKFIENYFKDSE